VEFSFVTGDLALACIYLCMTAMRSFHTSAVPRLGVALVVQTRCKAVHRGRCSSACARADGSLLS
jgi:hypothetical protein